VTERGGPVAIRAVEREDAPGVWVRIPGTVSGTPEQLGQLLEWLECSRNKRARLVPLDVARDGEVLEEAGELNECDRLAIT
jgi:hypothetical protein